MPKRKVGNPLAFAVLGSLAERPMHPYEISTLLRARGKDQSIKMNYGSLYSVVAALEKNGFIEALETVREGNRPERTVYKDGIRYLQEVKLYEVSLTPVPMLESAAVTSVKEFLQKQAQEDDIRHALDGFRNDLERVISRR